MVELLSYYFKRLDNAGHVDSVHKVLTLSLNAAEDIEGEMFKNALAILKDKFMKEQEVYKTMTKDWNVEDLVAADRKQDQLLSTIRAMLRAQTYLPKDHPNQEKATQLLKWFEIFDLNVKEAYGKETAKARNIYEELVKDLDALKALGVKDYVDAALLQTSEVDRLLVGRLETKGVKVTGEMKAAREEVDEAVKNYYLVLNSMQAFMPSEALTTLALKCKEVETHAKLHYLNSGSKEEEEPTEPETPTPDDTPAEPETPAE